MLIKTSNNAVIDLSSSSPLKLDNRHKFCGIKQSVLHVVNASSSRVARRSFNSNFVIWWMRPEVRIERGRRIKAVNTLATISLISPFAYKGSAQEEVGSAYFYICRKSGNLKSKRLTAASRCDSLLSLTFPPLRENMQN